MNSTKKNYLAIVNIAMVANTSISLGHTTTGRAYYDYKNTNGCNINFIQSECALSNRPISATGLVPTFWGYGSNHEGERASVRTETTLN